MIDDLLFVLAFLAALGSSLISGLFFAFSVCVMTALGRLPPASGIAAMQSINAAILNTLFYAVFLGTAAACVILAAAALVRPADSGAPWLLSGAAFYVVGNVLVTILFNVPLNESLARIDPESGEGAGVWRAYLSAWTRWNHVRTVASLAATTTFIMALCSQANEAGAA